MDEQEKKPSGRIPLRLPDALNLEVRRIAKGDGKRPSAGLNETLLFIIEKGLEAIKKENEPGNWMPVRKAA